MFFFSSSRSLLNSILQGERATWPLLSLIRIRTGIEKMLEEITQDLKRERDVATALRERSESEDEEQRHAQAGKIDKRRKSTLF